MMFSAELLIAFLGGVLPALLWLTFWLLEDRCQPEPKRYIFFCFVLGMFTIPFVLQSERFAAGYLTGPLLLLAWAAIEEIFKFGAAYLAAFRSSVFDEPLDAVIYMVTAALGFAALENVLFILVPLESGNWLQTVVTGDLRFIGATLLHTLSSATIGIVLAFTFYQSARIRRMAAVGGVILATLLHTVFNLSILGQGGSSIFWVFLLIWLGIVGALLLVERVKQPSKDYC
jgi:RsiW-degrading membrane proteinase PrsW (M82 family)